jgi:hypothetical protein
MTRTITQRTTEERKLIYCEVCGVFWEEHTADCPRHDYRPAPAGGEEGRPCPQPSGNPS